MSRSSTLVRLKYAPVPDSNFTDSKPTFDFSDPNIHHDRVFLVEGKKFHVMSGLLSTWSEYFKGLFGSKLSDANQEEIEIKEVAAEDFEQFLLFIYPSRNEVSASNCVSLIEMAHRFLAPGVMVDCNKFFQENLDEIDLCALLEVAFKLGLEDFKARIESIICASPLMQIDKRSCKECKYSYYDGKYCPHPTTGVPISVNSFIHKNREAISRLSTEAQLFVYRASVGNYEEH